MYTFRSVILLKDDYECYLDGVSNIDTFSDALNSLNGPLNDGLDV